MISHELSTIQQNAAAQDWLQSCPGYVPPNMEGLDSPFRVAYLPVRTCKQKPPRKRSYSAERAAMEAELAEQIRALAEQNNGITAICTKLAADQRRVHRIASQYQITIPVKTAFRMEAV